MLCNVLDVQNAYLPALVVIHALHLLLWYNHEVVRLSDPSFELSVSAHGDPGFFAIVLVYMLDCSCLAVYFPYCANFAPEGLLESFYLRLQNFILDQFDFLKLSKNFIWFKLGLVL